MCAVCQEREMGNITSATQRKDNNPFGLEIMANIPSQFLVETNANTRIELILDALDAVVLNRNLEGNPLQRQHARQMARDFLRTNQAITIVMQNIAAAVVMLELTTADYPSRMDRIAEAGNIQNAVRLLKKTNDAITKKAASAIVHHLHVLWRSLGVYVKSQIIPEMAKSKHEEIEKAKALMSMRRQIPGFKDMSRDVAAMMGVDPRLLDYQQKADRDATMQARTRKRRKARKGEKGARRSKLLF